MSSMPQAASLIGSTAIDAVVLDFYLKKKTAVLIAELLLGANTPFLFHTGAPDGLEQTYPSVPILRKSAQPELLIAEIGALVGRRP